MRHHSLFVIPILLCAIGCGSKESAEILTETSTYSAGAVSGGGSIKGTVSTANALLPVPPITMNADQGACGGESHPNPAAPAINGGKALSGVVMFLTSIESGKAFDDIPNQGTLDQNHCEFSPHLQLVRKGSPVIVSNSDEALHNVHVTVNGKSITNNVQPVGAPPVQATMNQVGINKISCDVHPWMRAYIIVADNPYYAITDSAGSYSLSNVPPGEYELTAWRDNWILNTEHSGERVTGYTWGPDLVKTSKVTVKADAATLLDIVLQ